MGMYCILYFFFYPLRINYRITFRPKQSSPAFSVIVCGTPGYSLLDLARPSLYKCWLTGRTLHPFVFFKCLLYEAVTGWLLWSRCIGLLHLSASCSFSSASQFNHHQCVIRGSLLCLKISCTHPCRMNPLPGLIRYFPSVSFLSLKFLQGCTLETRVNVDMICRVHAGNKAVTPPSCKTTTSQRWHANQAHPS